MYSTCIIKVKYDQNVLNLHREEGKEAEKGRGREREREREMRDLHKDVCSSEKLTAILKQEASSFVALLLRSITHTGLYTVPNMRGVASPGAWLVDTPSSVGVTVRRDSEIECPTRRNLVGVVFEVSAAGLIGEFSSTLGALFATKLFFITSDKQCTYRNTKFGIT